ncbi:MAG: ComEC/Rec2 family competence protein [Treponema sp.]|nr:ComEC/Rec2 family competence protein [Treponema sp.]
MVVYKYLRNSFILAALILIFIIYTGIIRLPVKDRFLCSFDNQTISCIYGRLKASPVKLSNGKYYSSTIKSLYVKNNKNQICRSYGNIKIIIPSESAEAFFPGKLYSKAVRSNAALYETGGIYALKGKIKNNTFYVEKCSSYFFENTLYGKLSYFRALARLQFKRMMYSWNNAGGFLLALLSGSREYTEPEMSQYFKKSGLSHILALSGMHLTLFSGISMFFTKNRKKISYFLRFISVFIFVWFAGLSPSLLRAFICNMLLLISLICNSDNPDMIVILSFSFIIQTIIAPNHLYEIAFILSYLALLSILIFNTMFKKIYVKYLPFYVSTSLASSTSAQILTAPVSLHYFKAFYPIGIISTIIISPLVSIFIYFGLALIILNLIFPFLQTPCGFFMNFLYNIIRFLVMIFSKMPSISIK